MTYLYVDYFVLFWFVLLNKGIIYKFWIPLYRELSYILTVISLTSSAYLCYYIKVYSESNVLF